MSRSSALIVCLLAVLAPVATEEFDADSAHDSLSRFRQGVIDQVGTSRVPWQEMSNEQRLQRLQAIALLSGDALSLSAEHGLMVLKPITGEAYVHSLAAKVGMMPQLLLQAAPRKYAEARRAVEAMGGDTSAFDREMRSFGDKLLRALDAASDPEFIDKSLQ